MRWVTDRRGCLIHHTLPQWGFAFQNEEPRPEAQRMPPYATLTLRLQALRELLMDVQRGLATSSALDALQNFATSQQSRASGLRAAAGGVLTPEVTTAAQLTSKLCNKKPEYSFNSD